MSRLDSFIRRMQAQRACLDKAAALIADVPGPVLELGLGNGRTYDHMREIMPDRRIYVFDRQVLAHPSCIPPDEDLFLGEFRDTVPTVAGRVAEKVALFHADFGQGDAASIASMAQFLAETFAALAAPGAVIVSDQPLHHSGWDAVPLPDGIQPRRYFMQRVHR